MYKKLLDKIQQYNCIAIFRHQKPDGDAVFSSLALYHFLKDNFKDKTIKLAGNDKYDVISRNHKISDSFIKKSLVIVLDTSNHERIDDDRAMNGDFIVKIDHHPVVDKYGDLNIVDTNASAAAHLLAKILLSKTFSKYKISKDVYKYLYCGIVTDTINFRTTNTTADTFKMASVLIEKGDLKVAELNEWIMDYSLVDYQKITNIRKHLKIKKKFGYICLNNKHLNDIGFNHIEAKNKIDEIGTIQDINIWAFATQDPDGKYGASIRSKRKYIINAIAHKYGGGGHPNAAAVKSLTKKQLDNMFDELIELSTKYAKNAKKGLK